MIICEPTSVRVYRTIHNN